MTRAVKVLVLVLIGVIVGVPTAIATFEHSSRDVVIGAHNATVRPTFDGHATLDFGPLLPRMRVPAQRVLGLGVDIDLGDSEVTSLNELAARDAVIASQPQGEIAKVTSTVVEMARDAILRGLGAALLAVVGSILVFLAVGPERRSIIWAYVRGPTRRQLVVMVSAGAAVLIAAGLIVVPDWAESSNELSTTEWTKLSLVIPAVPKDKVLDKVEISQGAAGRGSEALLEGAVKTYRTSVVFYGKLAKRAATVAVRTPAEGESTALVVTDRHDNIGMDKAARVIADQAKARTLFDLGDDTSSGGNWEDFSINSLAKAFKGFTVVAVAGNHDTGSSVRENMRKAGFHVLAGEPRTIDGIRFLGASDPRSSGLTAGYNGNESDSSKAIHDQDAQLTTAACKDAKTSVILVHSPSAAKKAAASGCVDLVLSGHLHRQVGPTVVQGENGRQTVTLTTGSTGGAAYAFALGSKLRRPAQVTIVTFKDGLPVGVQPIDISTGGDIAPQEYVPITVSAR